LPPSPKTYFGTDFPAISASAKPYKGFGTSGTALSAIGAKWYSGTFGTD